METTNKYRLTILVLAVCLAYCLGIMTPFATAWIGEMAQNVFYWRKYRLEGKQGDELFPR